MALPPLIGKQATQTSAASTTIAVGKAAANFPTHAVDDVMVIFVNSTGGINMTMPAGWVRLFWQPNGTTNTAACFVKRSLSADVSATSFTVTLGASQTAVAAIYIYRGSFAEVANFVRTVIAGTNNAPTSPTFNVPTPDTVVLNGIASPNNAGITPPSGFTEDFDLGSPSATPVIKIDVSNKGFSSAGPAGSLAGGLPSSQAWVSGALAIPSLDYPAVLFLDTGGDATGNTQGWTVTGTVTSVTTQFRTGPRSISCDSTGSNVASYVTKTAVLSDGGRRISFAFRFTALPAANADIFVARTASADSFRIKLLTTGKLQLDLVTAGQQTTGTLTLAINTWYRIVISYKVTSTTVNDFRIYVDGASTPDITRTNGTLTTIGATDIRTGIVTVFGASKQVFVDDYYIDGGTDLLDPGAGSPAKDLRVTYKAAATQSSETFDTNVGTGGTSAAATVTALSERPISETNGLLHGGTGVAEATFTPQAASAGDVNISTKQVRAVQAFAWAKKVGTTTTHVDNVVLDGVNYPMTLGTTSALHLSPVVTTTLYPSGVIGVRRTTGGAADFGLYEVGLLIAYTEGAPVVSLVIANTAHSHTVENETISQAHNLTSQNGSHSHTAQNDTLSQVHALALQSGTHSHTAQNGTLNQVHGLTLQSATHAHGAENTSVSPAFNLTLQNTAHGHTVEGASLAQTHVLGAANTAHGQTAQSLTLAQVHLLATVNASHSHGAQNVTLSQVHSLGLQSANHAHSVTGATLSQAHTLALASATHAHQVENVTIAQAFSLTLQSSVHGHTTQSPALSQAHILGVQGTAHAHEGQTATLGQTHQLSLAHALHAHLAQEGDLDLTTLLAAANALHSHAVQQAVLGQSYLLQALHSHHSHFSTGEISQIHNLALSNALHLHTATSPVVRTFGPPVGPVAYVESEDRTAAVTSEGRLATASDNRVVIVPPEERTSS